LAAGQLTGTEGYTPAVAGGWLAGTNAALLAKGETPITLPITTMLGALVQYITSTEPKHFQPMPPNFGIMPDLPQKIRNKVDRYRAYRDRALTDLEQISVAKRTLAE
jgi:methylenetetrahydrofolate--tRNA-(uracil-5-)-methyltransferase